MYSYGLMWLPPEYDEILVANAALNCPSNVFIEQIVWFKGQCIPSMLSSYIGGVMALPYRFLFLLFEPSVLAFRVFNIVLFSISLLLIYFAVKNYLSKKIAILTVFLLGFDFQLFYNVRLERTTVIPFLLKSLFLYVASRYLLEKKAYMLFLAGLFAGIGIWAKFDAVFFYSALGIAFVLSSIRQITITKKFLVNIGVGGLGIALGILPLLYYLRNSFLRFLFIGKEVAGGSFLSMISQKFQNLFFQFFSYDGVWYIFRDSFSYSQLEILLSVLVLIAFCAAAYFALKQKQYQFIVFTLFIFYSFYFLYGGLKFSHHRAIIYPLPHILLAFYIFHARSIFSKLVPFIFVLVFFLSLSTFYTSIANKTPNQTFATEVYGLAKYLEKVDSLILIGDWGITNQLLLLTNNRTDIKEIAFAANTSTSESFSEELISDLKTCEYVVLRRSDSAIFTQADENLRSAVNGKLVYTDRIFEVYSCESK